MTKDRFERTARNVVFDLEQGLDSSDNAVNRLVEACRAEVNETANSFMAAQLEKNRQRYEREKYNRKTIDDYLNNPVLLFMLKPKIVMGSTLIAIALTVWIGKML